MGWLDTFISDLDGSLVQDGLLAVVVPLAFARSDLDFGFPCSQLLFCVYAGKRNLVVAISFAAIDGIHQRVILALWADLGGSP